MVGAFTLIQWSELFTFLHSVEIKWFKCHSSYHILYPSGVRRTECLSRNTYLCISWKFFFLDYMLKNTLFILMMLELLLKFKIVDIHLFSKFCTQAWILKLITILKYIIPTISHSYIWNWLLPIVKLVKNINNTNTIVNKLYFNLQIISNWFWSYLKILKSKY